MTVLANLVLLSYKPLSYKKKACTPSDECAISISYIKTRDICPPSAVESVHTFWGHSLSIACKTVTLIKMTSRQTTKAYLWVSKLPIDFVTAFVVAITSKFFSVRALTDFYFFGRIISKKCIVRNKWTLFWSRQNNDWKEMH